MLNIEGATNIYQNSISDHGARTVLGMNGSLNSYIHTGNPYHNTPVQDEYVNSSCKKSGIHKVLDFLAYGTALGVGAFACFKNKAKISEFFNKHFSNLSTKIKSFDFSKIKEKLKIKPKDASDKTESFTKKIGKKIKEFNIKDLNIKNLFKKNNA